VSVIAEDETFTIWKTEKLLDYSQKRSMIYLVGEYY
jgi:hypothetical protein